MSDDSMAGTGRSIGDISLKNENDTVEVAKRLGLKEAFFLNYPNHNMDAWPIVEMRARLIFIFRAMKVDTVVVYDPTTLYERKRWSPRAGWRGRNGTTRSTSRSVSQRTGHRKSITSPADPNS